MLHKTELSSSSYNVINLIIKVYIVFSFFKSDPLKKLNKEYDALLEKAMQAQRSGDILLYSQLTEQAEKIYQEIQERASS